MTFRYRMVQNLRYSAAYYKFPTVSKRRRHAYIYICVVSPALIEDYGFLIRFQWENRESNNRHSFSGNKNEMLGRRWLRV
jgi:hypothetical protein